MEMLYVKGVPFSVKYLHNKNLLLINEDCPHRGENIGIMMHLLEHHMDDIGDTLTINQRGQCPYNLAITDEMTERRKQ